MKKLLLTFIIAATIFSCKDDDIVSNRVIFTMSFDGSLFNNTSDTWIVLRDDDSGELIDSRMVDLTKPNVFESKKRIKSGKMTVSYIWATPKTDVSSASATVQVYSGVDVGSEWTSFIEGRSRSFDPATPGNTGRYNLMVKNVPPMYAFSVSDQYGTKRPNEKAQYVDGTVTISPFFSAGVKQLVTIDPQEGKQKYIYVDGITTQGQNVTIDYNDFQEFFRYVALQGTSGSSNLIINITGTAEAKYYNGYEMYNLYYNEYATQEFSKTDMSFGVLGEVPINRVEIDNGYSSYSFYGRPPTGVVPPYLDLLIEDKSYETFRVKGESKYLYSYRNYWHIPEKFGDPYITIDLYAPAGAFKNFNPFSDEMISKYSFNIDQLDFRYMQAITGDQTYQEFLDSKFAKDYDTTQPYEIFRNYVPRLN